MLTCDASTLTVNRLVQLNWSSYPMVLLKNIFKLAFMTGSMEITSLRLTFKHTCMVTAK